MVNHTLSHADSAYVWPGFVKDRYECRSVRDQRFDTHRTHIAATWPGVVYSDTRPAWSCSSLVVRLPTRAQTKSHRLVTASLHFA